MKPVKKILFFTKWTVPTDEERAAADKIGRNVVFRNAAFAKEGEKLEDCEAVAGLVPEFYKGEVKVIDSKINYEKLEKPGKAKDPVNWAVNK